MEKKISKNKYTKNIIVMIIFIFSAIFIIAKNNNITEIYNIIKNIDITYLIIAIICAFMFQVCEAVNIKMILASLSIKIANINAIKYAAVGFFFSSITPSASGGQPMQVYYMKKDKIEIANSTLTLLIEFASYQLVTVILASISLIFKMKFIDTQPVAIKLMLVYGMAITLIILLFIVLVITFNKVIFKVVQWLFKKLSSKLIKEKTKEAIINEILEYDKAATFIKKDPYIFLKVTFITMVQIISSYSIPFLIYKALGFNGYSYFQIFSMQALLSIAVSSIPVPGAVGVSESAFLFLFGGIYPKTVLGSAMILTRCANFYFPLIISPIIIYLAEIGKHNKVSLKNS